MQSVVLIPSLNPDEKLIRLLEGLHELDIRDILLVDDGSKPETKHYFEQARQMGCRVVTHAVNLGKGRALKTGFNAFLNLFPDRPGVVMADADGQHSPQARYSVFWRGKSCPIHKQAYAACPNKRCPG